MTVGIEIVTGDAATANVASMPANILLYGNPGTQKSTDAVRAFIRDSRCHAFAIPCEDGALKPIGARGLPVPDHPKYTVKTWGQMEATIGWLAQNRDKYVAVIIDGITPFSANIYKEAEEQHRGKKNKFEIPMTVRNHLVTLREWIRMLGLHCVMIAHGDPPAVNEGIFYPGAPRFSPKSMTREYFGQVDTVLRVDYVQQIGQPAQRVYYTGGDDWPLPQVPEPGDRRQWLTKNREGVNWAVVPADLRAFLLMRQPPYRGL